MRRLIHAAMLAAVALIAHGCSGLQWSKPGADAAAISRDLDACRAGALGSTQPVAPVGSSEASSDRRPMVLSQSAGTNERFVAEHEAARRCMLKRGYELR